MQVTIAQVLGLLGNCTFLTIHWGLYLQIRKNWRANRFAPGLAKGKLIGNWVRYLLWALWASSKTPFDLFILMARVPAVFLSAVLLLQIYRPRLKRHELFLATSLSAIVLAVGCGLALTYASPIVANVFDVLVTINFASVIFVALPKEIQQIARVGTGGMSIALQAAYAANYSCWFFYGLATGEPVLLSCFSLAALLSWIVVLEFNPSIREWLNGLLPEKSERLRA